VAKVLAARTIPPISGIAIVNDVNVRIDFSYITSQTTLPDKSVKYI
jgi:hypothetical protein